MVDSEDPTNITGIIDWQSASIEPSFMLAVDTPDFAQELPQPESSDDEPNAEADVPSPHDTPNAEADESSLQAKSNAEADEPSPHDKPNAEASESSPHEKPNAEANELSPQSKIRVGAEFCAKTWAVMLQICPKSRAGYNLDWALVQILAAGSAG